MNDKLLILSRIKEYFNFSTDTELAVFLGINKSTLSNWHKRKTVDYDLIFSKCEQLDKNWLIAGKEVMLGEDDINTIKTTPDNTGIPLIPISAFAGSFSSDTQILEYECERFVVPSFKGADFLISVKGSSMNPKYSSGDIVACKKLPIDTFFQWNKVYVIDTDQGALIKRILKGENEETVLIVSDNKKYPPFELHRSHIYNIAIVLGVIRLE